MSKQIKHKEIKLSDVETILSGPEMKQFAAGAKMAFGTPAAPTKKKTLKSVSVPASTVEFLRETSHEKEESKTD